MKSDFLIALTQLAAERHLPREQVLQAIEVALASAFKKDSIVAGQNISVKLNPNTGEVDVFALKTVVDEVEDSRKEIGFKEALKLKPDIAVGEEVPIEALAHQVSRIGAQTAKQVVLQRLRELERELVFEEFVQRIDDVISGVVDQIDPGRVLVIEMGRAQAILLPEEQVLTERYRKGQRLKLYVLDVRRSSKGPEILVSRTHKSLLRRLFEIEVPEVYNGVVEIKAIAREPGSRSKVAVASRQAGIDPVGSCIGMRGNRIQSIVNELQGEKIDVVRWDDNPKILISNALSPSEVVHVEMNEASESAVVVVPERQLSLAIGKEGQNVRLAAKLTGMQLDIKSMSEWELMKTQRPTEQEAEGAEEPAAVAELDQEAVAAEPVEAKAEAPVAEEVAEAPPEVEEPPAIEEAEVEKEPVAVAAAGETPKANKLSPEEELALLALEEEEEEEEPEGQELGEEIWKGALVPTGAGQIRFAEDIVEDFRGKGRKDRKGQRSAAGARKKSGSKGRR